MNPWLYLIYFSFRRQLRPQRLVVSFILFVVMALLVGLIGWANPWTVQGFARWIIGLPFCRFFLPIITLTLGAAVIGDDREDKTLVYLSSYFPLESVSSQGTRQHSSGTGDSPWRIFRNLRNRLDLRWAIFAFGKNRGDFFAYDHTGYTRLSDFLWLAGCCLP